MDYPYLAYFVSLIFLSYLYWRLKNRKIANWAFAITFVFFAFRAPVVGADTWDYIRYLSGERNFYNYDSRPLEPLFIFYRELLCSITSSYFVIMVINTFISLAPLYYITKKYSLNPPLSILLFCYFDGMLVYFVALRQVIALSLLYIPLIYLLNTEKHYFKKLILFLSFSTIAYCFHTSSVLFAFFIVLAIIPYKLSRMTCLTLILGSAVVGIVLERINVLDIFTFILSMEFSSIERLNSYMESDELKDTQQLHLLLRLAAFSFITFICMGKDKISHPFSKLFLICVIIYNSLYSVPLIIRITSPLMFFGSIVYTWIMGERYIQGTTYRKFVNIFIIISIVIFTRSKILWLSDWDKYDEARMHPYYFIFEDYRDHPSIKNFGTT